MTAKTIGPGSRVVCIRDWPWKDVWGQEVSGPPYGSKWTVKECPVSSDGIFTHSETLSRSGPFLTLCEWPLEGDIERKFAIKNFRVIDPDRELDILKLIAKNVKKVPEKLADKIRKGVVEYVD